MTNLNSIRFSSFPRTEPPPAFTSSVRSVFHKHFDEIGTLARDNGLKSDGVLKILSGDLEELGFAVESGKRADQKIHRPVFYGQNGTPSVRYEIDAYHTDWKCGLEVEAARAWKGNAVYRDLVLACLMVDVEYLLLAVPFCYRYYSRKRPIKSHDYDSTVKLADAIYSHDRLSLPFKLIVIGY